MCMGDAEMRGGPDVAELTATSMLRRMVEIPSLTGEEDELAEYVAGAARALGLAAHRDEAGNLLAETGSRDAPTIMLLGHLDTTPGELPVHEREGILYGRGSVDAKGPLATMLLAAARHRDSSDIRVVVAGAVGEEGDSPGARHLAKGEPPDAVIIGEPSGVGNVVLGYKGILRFRLDISRPGVHNSHPAPKAVEVAAGFWQSVREYLAPYQEFPRAFDRTIPTLVDLCGDIRQARVGVQCRTPLGFDSAPMRAWLREQAGTDRLTVLEEVPAVRSRRTDPVVGALSSGVREQWGVPTLKVKLGTSDMNVVGPAWSVPIAAYGPGDSRLDHTDEERIVLSEYLAAVDVLSAALHRLPAALHRARLAGKPC
jgi:[amino group carrier protein]-lysine/ornithine hydrolase